MGSVSYRLALFFCFLFVAAGAHALPPQSTSTTALTVTAGSVPVVSVPAKTVVTLTANVIARGILSGLLGPVTPGQVNFCDASATYCTGAHLLGTVQLTSTGSASYKFVPGPGTHSYKAVFVGTNLYAGSTSLPATLTVSDASGVSAVGIQASGGQGDYDLLGTVSPAGMVSPSGQVSFLDTTNSNYQLGTATLAPTGASNTSFRQSYSFQFPLGNGHLPGYVASGDFNNDGHPDILFASTELAAIYTLLGNGDGTFTTLSFPFAVQSDEAPLVADFNGDGKLDFVLRTKTGLGVFLGNGDGTFTAGLALSIAPLSTFAVADLNNDGIPDLLLGYGGSLYAYLGDGLGGFGAPKLAFQGIVPVLSTLTADFNRDGIIDVLLISGNNGYLQMLFGNGDGTFRSGPTNPVPGNNLGYGSVGVRPGAVGDINGDGIADIVIPEDFASTPPFVLLGNGDGTFNILPRDSHLISASNAVALADFNGDGILDVVFPDLYGGATNVYIGKGDGTFTPDIYSPGLAYFTSESLATADFNGDGQADIAEVFNGDYNQLVVLLSQPASTAAGYANNISPVGTGYHYVEAFYPGDANNPAGTSQTIALLAEQVQPNLTLTAVPIGGSLQGQAVTLTASLDQFFAQNHSASGSVVFTSNGNTLGTAQIANGTASLTTSALTAGADSLQAEYTGDTNFADAASDSLNYTVAPQQSQTITFPQPATPAYAGTSIVLTATASSGLPVVYAVISGPAVVAGSVLSYTGVGTVVVEADQSGGSGYLAAPPVQVTVAVVSLSEPVKTISPVISTVVTFASAGTLGSIHVLTQGAQNLDFNFVPGGSCASGTTYSAGQTCSVQFTFTPTRPGPRYGGITLTTTSGALLGNAYISGTGTGPQVNWRPGQQLALGTGLRSANGVAVDGNGNTYVAETGNVVKIAAATGTVTTFPFSGDLKDVAVDGSGNVFVVNDLYTYGAVVNELVAVNGSIPATPVIRTIAANFITLHGIAVDGNGDLFLTQLYSSGTECAVYEIPSVNGNIPTAPTVLTLATSFGASTCGPTGVAVDASGDLFVSDGLANSVYELLAVNGSIPATPTIRTLGNGFNQPFHVALDAAGDVFVADFANSAVKEIVAVNGSIPASNPAILKLGSGFALPTGVATDGSGNVFVSDIGLTQIAKLDFADPPSLNFANTAVGSTSSDSPQTVTLTNGGNEPLLFNVPTSGGNPTITPGFTIANGSTCPQLTASSSVASLAAGDSCNYQVSFTPLTGGLDNGFLVPTDNNLNVVNAPQTVPLKGTGTTIAPMIVFSVPNHIYGDPPFTVAASSNSQGIFTYSVVSGPATILGSTVTLTGAGTVTLLASEAASGAYSAASQTATFTVGKQSQTINFAPPASPVNFGITPVSLAATASSGLPVSISVLSGPATVSGNALTFTASGTVIIAADQAGNSNYNAAAEVTRTIIVLGRLVSLGLTASPNPVFLRDPLSLVLTLAATGGIPSGSVTFLDGANPLGTVTVSGSSATLITTALTLGVHSVTAIYSGDSVFAQVTSSPVAVTVQDFTLTSTNPSVTIDHGGTATYNLILSSVGGIGLASTVNLSITGAPDHSEIVFTPSVLPTGSGSTPVTLVIHTPNYPVGPWSSIQKPAGTIFACMSLGALFLSFPRRKRLLPYPPAMVKTLLVLTMGFLSLVWLSGCGSGWRTQVWTMQVTATSGALSRSATLTLTSQCSDGRAACPVE